MPRDMFSTPIRSCLARLTWVGLAALVAGCGSSQSVIPETPRVEKARTRETPPPTGPLPRFALWHLPWHGLRSSVELFDEGEGRVLQVYRSVDPQYLGVWKVRLTGSDAEAADELVKELTASAGTVHSCPRPQGPDGALWVVRGFAAKVDCVSDFYADGSDPQCGKFAQMASKFMQLGKLQCGYSACLRPEERESRKFSCASGKDGDDCRDPSNAGGGVPEAMMRGLLD